MKRFVGPLLSLPATVWVIVLLFIPVGFIGAYSVNLMSLFPEEQGGLSTEKWREFVTGESPYLRLFGDSFMLATTVALVCVVLAFPLAYFLAKLAMKRRYLLLLLLTAPALVSYLLRVIAWKVILGDEGVINSFAFWTGLRAEGDPIPQLLYSRFAVMIILIYGWLPFAALPMYAVISNLDPAPVEAAVDLGSSRWGAFWRVTAPLSLPGVIAAFVAVFTPTLGEFIAPQLVGGTSTYLYGNAVSSLFGQDFDWRTGSVLALFLFLFALVALAILARVRLVKDLAT